MFWRELKSFFYFRPKEKRGILVLSFFCLLLVWWRYDYPLIEDQNNDTTEVFAESYQIDTFPCLDLRNIGLDILLDFGLTNKQANTLQSFQKKVRPIKSYNDLYSLYNFDTLLLHRLGSSLAWEAMNPISKESVPNKLKLDLNKMTSKDFKRHFGLSKKISNRIVAYRRLLGGYYDLNQLCEVYYFPCSKLEQIPVNKMELDYSKVKQLSLNNSTFETLSRHPYINLDQCKAIIEYKSRLNRLMNPSDLSKLKGFSKADIKKLTPYLSD